MIKFVCENNNNKMLNLPLSRQGMPYDLTTLDPTCIAVPPIQIGLSESHLKFSPADFM